MSTAAGLTLEPASRPVAPLATEPAAPVAAAATSSRQGPAIRVQGVSKLYRLGTKEEGPDTVTGYILSWLRSPWRNLKKLHSLTHFAQAENSAVEGEVRDDVLWSLRDVSFEVPHGEVTGVIGGNGAGKSTLLKLISRISQPSRGRISIWGRIASLLEVGTGFHQDLTGRENVYLKGAILGMTHQEITRKFDEIVEFAGVSRFIDTPVKRYSSGMRMRLAFSVAAHLEPEILLIDEVLAVGDRHFQQRCAEKLREVTKGGRTALVVSHDIETVRALCKNGILLKAGRLTFHGPIDQAVQGYLEAICPSGRALWEASNSEDGQRNIMGLPVQIRRIAVVDAQGDILTNHPYDQPYFVEVTTFCPSPVHKTMLDLRLLNESMEIALYAHDIMSTDEMPARPAGISHYRVPVAAPLLSPGNYRVTVGFHGMLDRRVVALVPNVCPFVLTPPGDVKEGSALPYDGVIMPTAEWTVEPLG